MQKETKKKFFKLSSEELIDTDSESDSSSTPKCKHNKNSFTSKDKGQSL